MKNLCSRCDFEKGDLSCFKAQEFMDDGSNIDLTVEIDKFNVIKLI